MLGFVKASDLVEKRINSSSTYSLQESVSLTEDSSVPSNNSLANSILPVTSDTVTSKRASDDTLDRAMSGYGWKTSSGSYFASGDVIDLDTYGSAPSGPSHLRKIHLDPDNLYKEGPSDSGSNGSEDTPTVPPVSGPGLNSRFGGFQLASSLVLSTTSVGSTHTPVTSSDRPSSVVDPATVARVAVSRRGKKSSARPLPKITNFFETYVHTYTLV